MASNIYSLVTCIVCQHSRVPSHGIGLVRTSFIYFISQNTGGYTYKKIHVLKVLHGMGQKSQWHQQLPIQMHTTQNTKQANK